MSLFTEVRNLCLIKELERELNSDVLLFSFDGFTFFGSLQDIEDCRIATLTPAKEAETTNVEILTPGGEVQEVEFTQVDLWQVVAKGTGIKNDPLEDFLENERLPDSQDATARLDSSCDLVRQLCRMVGEEVVLTTFGGFLFEGTLSQVDDKLAFLKVDEIFVPGTSSSISSDDVRAVVVNLEALTSVSKAVDCCHKFKKD